MGLLEILCLVAGLGLGTIVCLHSQNDHTVIVGAMVGAFVGLGVSMVIRQVSYRLFGYRRSKDDHE